LIDYFKSYSSLGDDLFLCHPESELTNHTFINIPVQPKCLNIPVQLFESAA